MTSAAQPGSRTVLPPRAQIALALGAVAGSASRALRRGRGTTMPGRVALRLAPDLLASLTRGRRVLLVSGTNGKTTTTRLLATALGTAGPVISNVDGANLLTGLVSTLLTGAADTSATAVLEVDERALPRALAQAQPVAVVLLNLTRDQLDRTGEVAFHVRAWAAALRGAMGTVVVANADDPLVVQAVLDARPDAAHVVWVAAGQAWRQDVPLCPRCGAQWYDEPARWQCDACGFGRPATGWAAGTDVIRTPAGLVLPAALALPGRVNVGNAVLALAASAESGVDAQAALAAMREVTDVGGRYLSTTYRGAAVRLLLAKNPAGWAAVLDQLETGDGPVVVTVNAEPADGRDTSWLWDVPFERLQGRRVVAAGDRSADVSLRLHYADVEHVRRADPLAGLVELGASVDVVATYTAFRRVRDRLMREPGLERVRGPA